jgi:hypothetical protein
VSSEARKSASSGSIHSPGAGSTLPVSAWSNGSDSASTRANRPLRLVTGASGIPWRPLPAVPLPVPHAGIPLRPPLAGMAACQGNARGPSATYSSGRRGSTTHTVMESTEVLVVNRLRRQAGVGGIIPDYGCLCQ